MRIAFVLAVLALAGCEGTIAQNRVRTPSATFSSQHSEPTLEQCLAGNLSWAGDPSVIRGENSTEIAFSSVYGTELLLTIIPHAGGSTLELRMKHKNYLGHLSRAVEACL
jgi:hypothetical protein